MVSSIHQSTYVLLDSSGTYKVNTLYYTSSNFWCNYLDIKPEYSTIVQGEDGSTYLNTVISGAPTLPVTVESEINGSSVTQNLAPQRLKEPIILYFKLKDNYELPDWLTFEEGSGRIYGKPPNGTASFSVIEFTNLNGRVEMYLRDLGQSDTQPFDKNKATLRGFCHGIIKCEEVNTCRT